MRKGDTSISSYFTQSKRIWKELENFHPIPACLCVDHYTCLLAPIKDYRQKDYDVRFLRRLNKQYNNVRWQVMLLEPLPQISKVFSHYCHNKKDKWKLVRQNLEWWWPMHLKVKRMEADNVEEETLEIDLGVDLLEKEGKLWRCAHIVEKMDT